MGSIDMSYFLNLSPPRLMIKIWEFSFTFTMFRHLTQVLVIVKIIWNVVLMLPEKFGTMKTTFILIVLCTNFNSIKKNIRA